MCLQNALDCKTCPNGALSAFLAVAIGAGLYLIGIVLGNGIVLDKEVATDSNPIQNREKVSSRPTCPASGSTCLLAASGGAETAAKANSEAVHRFFIVQATHGALLISPESCVRLFISKTLQQLMVLYSSLLNHLYLYLHLMLLFQVHANILSAIVGVDWQWKSAVSGIMGLSTASTGSVLEFDLGWRLAAVRQAS